MKRWLSSFVIKSLILLLYSTAIFPNGHVTSPMRRAFKALSNYKKLPRVKEDRKKAIRRHKGEYLGILCEVIAAEASQEREPHLRVLRNVKYQTTSPLNKVEGELDLVIFNPKTKQVQQIKEVKCCWDVFEASRKGRSQLERFNKLIEDYKEAQNMGATVPTILFTVDPLSNENPPTLNPENFFNKPSLKTVTYDYWEAEQAGFDETIELSHQDLRDMLTVFANLEEELEEINELDHKNRAAKAS